MNEKQFLNVVEGEDGSTRSRTVSIPLVRRLHETKPKESVIDRLVRSLADAAKQIAEPLWALVTATQSKGGSGRLPSAQNDYSFNSWNDIHYKIQLEIDVATLDRLTAIKTVLEQVKSLLLTDFNSPLLFRLFPPSRLDKNVEKQHCLKQIDEILGRIAVTRLIRIIQQQE
jgi:hypothetical protein